MSFRKGRAYAKAVPHQPPTDDDMDLIAPATGVFIDERELRPGVDYLVSPGAQLKFGEDLARSSPTLGQQHAYVGEYQPARNEGHGSVQVTPQMTRRRSG